MEEAALAKRVSDLEFLLAVPGFERLTELEGFEMPRYSEVAGEQESPRKRRKGDGPIFVQQQQRHTSVTTFLRESVWTEYTAAEEHAKAKEALDRLRDDMRAGVTAMNPRVTWRPPVAGAAAPLVPGSTSPELRPPDRESKQHAEAAEFEELAGWSPGLGSVALRTVETVIHELGEWKYRWIFCLNQPFA